MKRKLLVMVSLWAVLPLSAQRFMRTDDFTLLDEGICSVSYEVSYVLDSTKPAEKEKDVFRLDVGERWSKSYSYALFRYDSICTKRTLKGQKDVSPVQGFRSMLTPPVFVFRFSLRAREPQYFQPPRGLPARS